MRDSTQIYGEIQQCSSGIVGFSLSENPGSGNHTYSIEISGEGQASARSPIITENKK